MLHFDVLTNILESFGNGDAIPMPAQMDPTTFVDTIFACRYGVPRDCVHAKFWDTLDPSTISMTRKMAAYTEAFPIVHDSA
jgi:hypothetical protein